MSARQADPHTLKIIGGWLKALADLTRASADDPVSTSKLTTYATMLAKDLPIPAFTTDSLHFIAGGKVFFPAYEDIRASLVAWWNERKPSVAPQITDRRFDGLNDDERSWLRYYDRAFANGFDGTSAARVDGLLRAQAPRVWERVHPEKPGISFETVAARMQAEWNDEDGIYARVHACGGDRRALRLLRAIVGRWAPQHLEMIPAD